MVTVPNEDERRPHEASNGWETGGYKDYAFRFNLRLEKKDLLPIKIYAASRMTWRIGKTNCRECMNGLCPPLLEC